MVHELDLIFNETFFNFTELNATSHYCVVAGVNTLIICQMAIIGLLTLILGMQIYGRYRR